MTKEDIVRKKISFLISSLGGGGAEGVCVNVANGLAELGWDVEIVVLNNSNGFFTSRVSSNVKLVCLGISNARFAIFQLLRYFKANKPHGILCFNYELSVLSIFLKKIFFLKFKVISRNINAFSKNAKAHSQSILGSLFEKVIINSYRNSDYVINQCYSMQEDLLSVIPDLKDRTDVIYNPVARYIEDYNFPIHESNSLNQDYILCVGRLEKQKAFHLAIEAFSKISNKFPKLRLKIIGDGSLKSDLINHVNRFNLISRVDFEGLRSDLIPFYTSAKFTLLTSLYEGFPNVLVESTFLGTPIVAYDCLSGPSEIVIEDVNGVLFSDFELLPHIMTNLLLDNRFNKEDIIKSSERYKIKNVSLQYSILLERILYAKFS